MAASEAQVIANRQNSLQSTGPRTIAGKERSRRNGLKHGLTGQGVVVSEAESTELARRTTRLQAEMAPRTTLGAVLIGQIAFLSVRLERGAEQETAAQATRVRHAPEAFDDEQYNEAERLLDVLGDEPRINLRKLKKTPEGIDRLIVAWEELRSDLTLDPKPLWTASDRQKAENLMGRRIDDAQGSRIRALTEAIWGDFKYLKNEDGAGLAAEARKAWARARMVELIDAEIESLVTHYESLDFETLDLDRAEAGSRSLFDPSHEATLARRYDAAAQRAFFKALNEFRNVEAQAIDLPSLAPAPEIVPPSPEMASSCKSPMTAQRPPDEAPMFPVRSLDLCDFETARTADGQIVAIGRPISGPA